RPFTFFRFDFDFSTMCFNNIVRQTQSQSSSLTRWLGRKEWLKYFIQYLLGNTIAIVLNLNLNFSIVFRRTYSNRWLISFKILFLFFVYSIESIVGQIENDSS